MRVDLLNTISKVTMTDNGSISFPSITICKDEMYDNVNGLMKRLQSGELAVENASSWFRNGFNIVLTTSEIQKLILKT